MRKEITGCYVTTLCCTKCNWYSVPLEPQRSVCPICGSGLVETVGRFQIIETKRFFSGIEREFIGFIRKGLYKP